MTTADQLVRRLVEDEDEDFDVRQYVLGGIPQARSVNLSDDVWKDDRLLRLAFSWLTRVGLAPKFGTLPVGYYQQDQIKALDAVTAACKAKGANPKFVRYRNGVIESYTHRGWLPVARLFLGRLTPL